jgi:hypothetical protein
LSKNIQLIENIPVEKFGQISGVLFWESRCERQEIVVVGGHDQQPRPHVKGDGHAPQVPAGGDASYGADRRYKILNLKYKKQNKYSSEN